MVKRFRIYDVRYACICICLDIHIEIYVIYLSMFDSSSQLYHNFKIQYIQHSIL
jgi:hypothetical protein